MSLPIIGALSGGKDSTAMALRFEEVNPDASVTWVCTPTGNELPEMFAHWRRLREALRGEFVPLVVGTLAGEIDQQKMIPNHRARWCTRMLKIEPFAGFLAGRTPCVALVGLRADEEDREGGNYMDVPGVEMRYPLREWGWKKADVWRYLDERGVGIPKRTDCALCFWQTLGQWFDLWRDHPEMYAEGEAIEQRIGHTFRSPQRDSWPASLTELRQEFERGRIPRNRRNLDLFSAAQCRVCTL